MSHPETGTYEGQQILAARGMIREIRDAADERRQELALGLTIFPALNEDRFFAQELPA